MCGINGGWTKKELPGNIIEKSLDRMAHRGPDASNYLQDGNIFLGHRRLSIIDLQSGDQPIYNEDKSVAVVFNGEIYNFIELREELTKKGHTFSTSSDTEVLVHLYEEFGRKMCESLRGMFAFCILDSRERLLFLARDRFGKKPLYYSITEEGDFLFASELKGLLILTDFLGVKREIVDQSVYDYLSLGAVPQPNTIFKGLHSLPPAAFAIFNQDGLSIERYWSINFENRSSISYNEALEEIKATIAEAVRIRLRSDVELGIFLSGGIDSAIVAYEAAKSNYSDFVTFSIAVDDPALDESADARKTAEYLGVRNRIHQLKISPLDDTEDIIDRYDQPFADSSAMAASAVSRLAGGKVKVVLNGDGGDEFFAGYRRHLATRMLATFRFMPAKFILKLIELGNAGYLSRRSGLGFAARFIRGLSQPSQDRYLIWGPDLFRECDKRILWRGRTAQPTETMIKTAMEDNTSEMSKQMMADIKINLASDLLVKMDIATMAHSIEARSPLLDHKLAELVFSLPEKYKTRRWRAKSLLKDAYKGRLPDEILKRPKKGFEIPVEKWLHSELRDLLHDTLLQPNSETGTYVHRRFIQDLWRKKDYVDRNWAMTVYSLLVLELWLRKNRSSIVGNRL